jgi:hypothetical protein
MAAAIIRKLRRVVAIVAAAFLVSCAMLEHTIHIAPLPADLPVSASATLFVDGLLYTAADFSVVKEFAFEKLVTAKLKSRQIDAMLSDDLARIAREAGGNAIVGLKIVTLEIDSTALTLVWAERYAGVMALGAGGALLALPSALYGPPTTESVLYSVALLGTGAALLGGSFLHESLGAMRYWFQVSGTVVRY